MENNEPLSYEQVYNMLDDPNASDQETHEKTRQWMDKYGWEYDEYETEIDPGFYNNDEEVTDEEQEAYYSLDETDMETLKRLRKAHPDRGWTAQKYKKIMGL